MGEKNSSLTRVQPVFDYINLDIQKLNQFFSLFDKKVSITSKIHFCKYGENEASIKPPKELLLWCINNIDKLNSVEFEKIKESDSTTNRKRYALYTNDPATKQKALTELNNEHLPQKAWFIFEGYTHPDIYIETKNEIFIGEAKRTESILTTSTTWMIERDQLIRHIDSVIDSKKKVYSFFIFENPNLYNLENYKKIEYYKKSLPHRDELETQKIMDSYIGFTTWEKINNLFDNTIDYPDTI